MSLPKPTSPQFSLTPFFPTSVGYALPCHRTRQDKFDDWAAQFFPHGPTLFFWSPGLPLRSVSTTLQGPVERAESSSRHCVPVEFTPFFFLTFRSVKKPPLLLVSWFTAVGPVCAAPLRRF